MDQILLEPPGPIALAQAPAPAPVPAPTAKRVKSLLGYINDGGWIGHTIIGCSIIGLSLVITFAFQFRRDLLVPPEVLGQVEQLFEEENYEEAYHICESNPSFFSTILAAGLGKLDQGYEEMEKAMIETGDIEANKLHQKVGYISLIAAVAPMLGLFGTVSGMIATFNVIASAQTQPKPADLASGISQALVTTYEGLLVAIPLTVFFVIFRNRIVNIILEVGGLTEELMSRFKVRKA
ncbi:MAG: MotA/TolQ/ExbB proton channel family protein [Planctomycetes bacterium]|nr:MotA/TolQ/ExbB proton channel family protein [Planctomycetota bacterium]